MLTINRRKLLEALDSVKAGFTGRTSLPILSHVLIKTTELGYSLTGYDLEISVIRNVEQDFVEYTDPFVLVYSTLRKLVSEFSGEDVTFKPTDQGIKVGSGKSSYTLLTAKADEYPKVVAVEGFSFCCDAASLKQVLSKAVICASQDENRAILTGVMLGFTSDTKEIAVVSTDTHRLAVQKMVPLLGEDTPEESRQIIIPAKFVNELIRVLPTSSEEGSVIEITVGINHLRAVYGSLTLTSNLISGQFPNYQRVIPKEEATRVMWTVDVSQLVAAIKRSMTLAKETSSRIVFTGKKDGTLVLNTDSQMIGSGVEELDCVVEGSHYEKEDEFQTAFNGVYFTQALNSLTAPSCFISLSEPLKPAVLRVSGELDYLHVLMPMQVV